MGRRVPPGAADRLVEIALNRDDTAAFRAIEALNSRVLGRPKETIEAAAPVKRPTDFEALDRMTQQEKLDALYIELMPQVPLR